MGSTGKRSGVLQLRKERKGTWTKAIRAQFLLNLAATCNVATSCKAVGRSKVGLYQLRARDPGFARDWEQALEQGYEQLEAELLRQAMGDAVGEIVAEAMPEGGEASSSAVALPFNPDLALRLLTQRRTADRQGRRSSVRQKQPSPEEVLAALDRKLTAMEKRLGRKP